MTVNVRAPEVPDAAGIGVSHSRFWLHHFGAFIDAKYLPRFDEGKLVQQWHDLLAAPLGTKRVAVALEFGRVVGLSMSVPTARIPGGVPPARARELSMHFLLPEYQGTGLGRRLLDYVVGPTEPVQLWLPAGYAGEEHARIFYRRAGFLFDGAATGREENYGLPLHRLVR